MKKVLLTKTQQIRVSTPEITVKPQHSVTNTAIIIHKTNVITNTYIQRKSHQAIYEDIFKLLMKLPDKALQQRVIDAINGRSDKTPNQCRQCNQKSPKTDASTQTEILEIKEYKSIPTNTKKIIIKGETSPMKEECYSIKATTAATAPSTTHSGTTTDEPPATVKRKRGRKRNTCVPQVVKRSAAQIALKEREDKQLTPLPPVKKKKLQIDAPARCSSPSASETSDILRGVDDIDLLAMCNVVERFVDEDNQTNIRDTMLKELKKAPHMTEEGLLPIHDAILYDDTNSVQRQIFVWQKMIENVDINDLLSADGEDCLQLALTNDCETEKIKLILNAGLLPNHIYDESNTAVHLAVINNVRLESLKHLMLVIDLNLLLQTNDDGYTALHIAVRHNRYKMAEIMLDIIDQRQLGACVYMRESDVTDEPKLENGSKSHNLEVRDEKKFAKFYERACDKLDHNKGKLLGRRLKLEILNASEARAGNSSLFFAVESELEHFCYLLLAHLANPDEENLSGHSPKSFHYEFARILRINLKISRLMDKVMAILNGKFS